MRLFRTSFLDILYLDKGISEAEYKLEKEGDAVVSTKHQ